MGQGAWEILDPELKELLGDRTFRALFTWCYGEGRTIKLDQWLHGGKTPAVLAVVLIDDRYSLRKAVLKYCPSRAEVSSDFRNFRKALESGPPGFAEEHLIGMDPAGDRSIGNGPEGLFLLMKWGSGGLDNYTTMTRLLNGEILGTACKTIITSILMDWNNVKREAAERIPDLSAVSFLQDIVGRRCEPGGPIQKAAQKLHASCSEPLLPSSRGKALPNPLAAETSGESIEGMSVLGLRGNRHGDLHAENILIPWPDRGSPSADHFKRYVLIDLSTFSGRGLITVDPVHLLLSIVASGLADVADAWKDRLARLVLDPGYEESGGIPGKLTSPVRGIWEAGSSFAAKRGLYPEWRAETTLAIAGCALLFVGRDLPEKDREWFWVLAGMAIAAFIDMQPKRGHRAGVGDALSQDDLPYSDQTQAMGSPRPADVSPPGSGPVHRPTPEQDDAPGLPPEYIPPHGYDSAQEAALVSAGDASATPQAEPGQAVSLIPPVIEYGTATCGALAGELASEISALRDDMRAGAASAHLFAASGIVAELTAAIRTMLDWSNENPEERYITYQTALRAVQLQVHGVTEIMKLISQQGTSPGTRDDAMAAVERLQHAIRNIALLPNS